MDSVTPFRFSIRTRAKETHAAFTHELCGGRVLFAGFKAVTLVSKVSTRESYPSLSPVSSTEGGR